MQVTPRLPLTQKPSCKHKHNKPVAKEKTKKQRTVRYYLPEPSRAGRQDHKRVPHREPFFCETGRENSLALSAPAVAMMMNLVGIRMWSTAQWGVAVGRLNLQVLGLMGALWGFKVFNTPRSLDFQLFLSVWYRHAAGLWQSVERWYKGRSVDDRYTRTLLRGFAPLARASLLPTCEFI